MKRVKPRRRRLLFEQLEQREMLSGGRPLPPGSPGDNIALGSSYTWNYQPNGPNCTDPGDTTQLTDGQYSTGELWTQPSTVGWQDYTSPVEITIDLGVVQPIRGVSYSTAGGAAGVQWPTAINVAASNDNIHYYDVADLVALDPDPPGYGTYAAHRYQVTDGLATHGRYVRFEVVQNPSVFVDEIEVYRGADSLLGQNVALTRPYTLSPAPNYVYCTEPGDATQLTDGVYTKNYFWTQASTVGWQSPNTYAQIRIDLGADQPIEGISFNTAAGVAGVTWPTTIGVLVSTDGVNFYDGGEVIRLSLDHGLPPTTGYLVRSYWTDRLVTHGRYVKIVPADSPYLFVDEIEIYRGRNEMLSVPYEGSPITDVAAYVVGSQMSTLGVRRIVSDAQNVQQQVNAAAQLTPEEKAQLAGQLDAVIAQAMYDYPTQVVLPVDDLHRQVFDVQAVLWRAQGVAGLAGWTTPSAWDQISPTQSPPGASPASIDVAMMRGEFRAGAFNLSNSTDADLEVSVRFSGLPGGPRPSYVTVHEAQWTDTRSSIPHLAALPEATYDAERDAFLLHVPSGMTRQVWLTFHPTTATGPGTYAGTIVADGGSAGTVNVPIQLRVSTLEFPAQPALGLGGWDYTNTLYDQVTTTNRDAFIAKLVEHFVDTTWATNAVMPSTPTFTLFDQWVARWPTARHYRVFSNVPATFGGYAAGTPEFNQAVGAWISAYVAHWRAIGIDPSRVGLLLVDEPHNTGQSDRIVAWANAIKAAEPEVLIWEDPTWTNPADGTATFDVSDVLCPNRPMFLSGGETFRNVYRQERDAGKTLNFYSCSGPTEQLDPYSYYRLQAWTVWDEWGRVRDGPTAMFYWAFPDQGRAASWKTTYGLSNNYTPLFLEPDAVTDGKDMESIREGIEDYEYLQMLKHRIAELEARGVSASALADAKTVLDGAPSAVLGATGAANLYWNQAKDRNVADAVRAQVLDALEQLTAAADATLDADGNGTADALSDGILALRYLFDPAGQWNVDDALGSGATRTDQATIKGYLNGGRISALDADGNGTADALSDGILILRYLFDPGGQWNVADALGAGATRTTRDAIQAYLDSFNPSHAAPSPEEAAPADGDLLARVAAALLVGPHQETALSGATQTDAAPSTEPSDTAALDTVLEQWSEPSAPAPCASFSSSTTKDDAEAADELFNPAGLNDSGSFHGTGKTPIMRPCRLPRSSPEPLP